MAREDHSAIKHTATQRTVAGGAVGAHRISSKPKPKAGHLTGDRPSLTDSGKFQQLVPKYDKRSPTDILHVVMVRHGQSVANAARVIQGHTDSELTDRGHQEAILLGKMLSREHISMMYTSDLRRAKSTMEILCKCRAPEQQCEMQESMVLRERNAGVFEGEPVGTIDQAARAAGQAPREFEPSGGESWEEVRDRAEAFMQEVLERHLPPPSAAEVAHRKLHDKGQFKKDPNVKTVLVVTHGGFIKEFVGVMSSYGGGQLYTAAASASANAGRPRWPINVASKGQAFSYPNKAVNTGVFRFNMRWHNGRLTVAMVEENDATHLRGLPSKKPGVLL